MEFLHETHLKLLIPSDKLRKRKMLNFFRGIWIRLILNNEERKSSRLYLKLNELKSNLSLSLVRRCLLTTHTSTQILFPVSYIYLPRIPQRYSTHTRLHLLPAVFISFTPSELNPWKEMLPKRPSSLRLQPISVCERFLTVTRDSLNQIN